MIRTGHLLRISVTHIVFSYVLGHVASKGMSVIPVKENFVRIRGYDLGSPNVQKKLFLSDLKNQIRSKIFDNIPQRARLGIFFALNMIKIR